MVDMKHMAYLAAVSQADVAELRRKEATYQGSWKASGGRSAWFMIKRKIERLMVMLAQPAKPEGWDGPDELVCGLQNLEHARQLGNLRLNPERLAALLRDATYLADCYTAENIFAIIRRDPSGADGSALAEVRDLRRYLLLVEAEMVARRVVTSPVQMVDTTRAEVKAAVFAKGYGTPEDGGHHAHERLEDGLTETPSQPHKYMQSVVQDSPLRTVTHYIVDRRSVPPEEWDHLPRLQQELNHKEHSEQQQCYWNLYFWDESDLKWKMSAEYRDLWGRVP